MTILTPLERESVDEGNDLKRLRAILSVGHASCSTAVLALKFSTATFVSSHALVLLDF